MLGGKYTLPGLTRSPLDGFHLGHEVQRVNPSPEVPMRVFVGTVLLFMACGPSVHQQRLGVQTRPGEIAIDQAAIERSGAGNAWEIIKRAAPQFSYTENRGHPVRMWRRGCSSILLSDAPLLFIDDGRTPDFRNLELIPARQIDHIRILTGIEGTTYYGTNAEGGVILVYTKTGQES